MKLLDIYKGKINRFQDLVVKEASEINADLVVFDNSRSSAGSIEKLKDLGFSRQRIKQLIQQGEAKVNDLPCSIPKQELHAGDKIFLKSHCPK